MQTFNATNFFTQSDIGGLQETIDQLKEDIIEIDFSKRKDKAILEIGENSYEMKLSNILTTLILLQPFALLGELPDDEFIILKDENLVMNDRAVQSYLNMLVKRYDKPDILNDGISEVIRDLIHVSALSNYRIGNTMSIYTIYKLLRGEDSTLSEEEKLEMLDLLNTSIDLKESNQISDLNKWIDDRNNRLVSLLTEHKNHLQPFFIAGAGINKGQFKKCMINVGFQPDVYDNVIGEPINSNYLVGLKTVQDYFINAKGTRVSLIISHKKVRDSGYLNRKLSLLTMDSLLEDIKELGVEGSECNTMNTAEVLIKDETTLRRLNARSIIYDGEEFIVDEDTDKHLIGKVVGLYSPITCANENICAKCYGKRLASINKNIHVGILATLYLTEILTQMLLSSKHLLQAVVHKMNWGETFEKYFMIDRNTVIKNPDHVGTEHLAIKEANISIDEDTNGVSVDKLYIQASGGVETEIELPTKVLISSNLMESFKTDEDDEGMFYKVKLSDIDDMQLFEMVISNLGLATSLQAILDLIETSDHLGFNTYNGILNKFLDLLTENGIHLTSVHIEIIIRNLIRQHDDHYARPDFNIPVDDEDYVVLNVSESNIKNASLSIGLAFEKVKRQLNDPNTYEKRGSSILDPMFTK